MPFGQLIFGPPGSGKTTYCAGMQQFLNATGRNTIVINLDPANDSLPYNCDIDIRTLVDLNTVMKELNLGPNGGLLYCMEYLEKNVDWLQEQLLQCSTNKTSSQTLTTIKNSSSSSSSSSSQEHLYFIFDCPGQVELYTYHSSMKNITAKLQSWAYRLTSIHLVDSYYCSVPSTYISAVLTSLMTMLHFELPHVNVLSKIDLIETYGKLPFDLEFFTDVGNLEYLAERLEDEPFGHKYVKLGQTLCELVSEFPMVSYTTLNIQDKESVYDLVKLIDKSNGYIYGAFTQGNESIMSVAVSSGLSSYDRLAEVRERYTTDSWSINDNQINNNEQDDEDNKEFI